MPRSQPKKSQIGMDIVWRRMALDDRMALENGWNTSD
jgi:hypothetical protein